jgi:hypothetical protein
MRGLAGPPGRNRAPRDPKQASPPDGPSPAQNVHSSGLLTIGASAAARSERSEAERCRLNARVSRPAWPESRPQRPETGLAARRPFSGPERSFFGPANGWRISRRRAERSEAKPVGWMRGLGRRKGLIKLWDLIKTKIINLYFTA